MKLKQLVRKKRKTEYFLFAGKGGVGKTSMACATALYMSQKRKVLLISTDPAHSVSDSFDTRIGGEVKKVRKNLYAVEIDPKKAMAEYKDKFMPKIESMEALKGLGLGDTFDMAGMTPGIDEIAAFDKFIQYMQSDEYDVIIFDTAPTGHTLRFLSLPEILDSWIGKMIMLRMKFSGIAGMVKKFLPFGKEEEEKPDLGLKQMEKMKERIAGAKAILADPLKTHYNIVMIPEEMSILESERSLSVLKEYKINVDSVIVNQLIPENSRCPFCSEKRKQQQERLGTIRKKFSAYTIREAELLREELRGFSALSKVGREIWQNTGK